MPAVHVEDMSFDHGRRWDARNTAVPDDVLPLSQPPADVAEKTIPVFALFLDGCRTKRSLN